MKNVIILGDSLENTIDLEVFPLDQTDGFYFYSASIQTMTDSTMSTIDLGYNVPSKMIIRLNPQEIYSISLHLHGRSLSGGNTDNKRWTTHIRVDDLILLNIAKKLL